MRLESHGGGNAYPKATLFENMNAITRRVTTLERGRTNVPGRVLRPKTPSPTHHDAFRGTGLSGKWSRVGYDSADERHIPGAGMQVQGKSGAGNYYWQAAPDGDFKAVMCCLGAPRAGDAYFGIMALDDTGLGVGMAASNSGVILCELAAAAFSGGESKTNGIDGLANITHAGVRAFYRLSREGDDWKATMSLNGTVWLHRTNALTLAFTPTRLGFGTFYDGGSGVVTCSFLIDFFDLSQDT